MKIIFFLIFFSLVSSLEASSPSPTPVGNITTAQESIQKEKSNHEGMSWGFVGVIIGAIITGFFNFLTHRGSVKALKENLSLELKASRENQENELEHRKSVEQYKLMADTYKYAIEAAVDTMKAQWFKTAATKSSTSPEDAQRAILQYLEAWLRSWKASGQLRMFLPEQQVLEYDTLVIEMQAITPDSLLVNPDDPKDVENYNKRMESFRLKVRSIMTPLEKLIQRQER